uniref:Zinc transporter zip8 n=1 Tax=Echinococcus granulosus TaxID=6210 RepID=A0A068WAT0_ECHGR|nr:zinc transporter zip8 [Echinococcus granulosus]
MSSSTHSSLETGGWCGLSSCTSVTVLMASTLAFLTAVGSPTSLFRHWTVVIVILSLLSTDNPGFFVANAEPTFVLHGLSAPPAGLVPDPNSPNASAIAPITVKMLGNVSFDSNPLVTVLLKNFQNVEETKALLTIFSSNDSAFNNFVIEISNPPHLARRSLVETIIYSFLAVTVTNLCALTGFFCIPIKRSRHFPTLLNFMMALAVGALFCTAVLVLIPESLRMAEMPLEFGGQGRTYLYKFSCVPIGALFFFIVEYVLLILPRLLKWSVASDNDKSLDGTEIGDTKNWDENSNAPKSDFPQPQISGESAEVLRDDDLGSIDSVYMSQKSVIASRRRCNFHFSREKFSKIAPVAWMILFGDAFHNFMDGMTIGVGFTESPTIGIALTLSIIFEELPTELGDFAILVSSGFSIKSAVCANFLSACTTYLGVILGLLIGEVSTGALYVFAITAGFFLYISLADMTPNIREALEELENKNRNSFYLFLVQLGGLIAGFGCVVGITLVTYSVRPLPISSLYLTVQFSPLLMIHHLLEEIYFTAGRIFWNRFVLF